MSDGFVDSINFISQRAYFAWEAVVKSMLFAMIAAVALPFLLAFYEPGLKAALFVGVILQGVIYLAKFEKPKGHLLLNQLNGLVVFNIVGLFVLWSFNPVFIFEVNIFESAIIAKTLSGVTLFSVAIAGIAYKLHQQNKIVNSRLHESLFEANSDAGFVYGLIIISLLAIQAVGLFLML